MDKLMGKLIRRLGVICGLRGCTCLFFLSDPEAAYGYYCKNCGHGRLSHPSEWR